MYEALTKPSCMARQKDIEIRWNRWAKCGNFNPTFKAIPQRLFHVSMQINPVVCSLRITRPHQIHEVHLAASDSIAATARSVRAAFEGARVGIARSNGTADDS